MNKTLRLVKMYFAQGTPMRDQFKQALEMAKTFDVVAQVEPHPGHVGCSYAVLPENTLADCEQMYGKVLD